MANNIEKQLKEISERLEQGVKEIFTSERYTEYLNTMSKFHNYSFNNTLLITMQKPEATLVAGYQAWQKKFNRHVKRGEKGIQIIAPAPIREKKEIEKIDPVTKEPVIGDDGQPETEIVEMVIPRFRVTTVFDVSQTEGEPIAELEVPELTGSVQFYDTFMEALQNISPVPIRMMQIEGEAKGYYHQTEKYIAIQEDMSNLQTMKTGVHEVSHALLHDREVMDAEGVLKDQTTKEVEAESIAYIVCNHFGLDTSEYSFTYIASWCESKDMKALRASMDTIRKTSAEVIGNIETQIHELEMERPIEDASLENIEETAMQYAHRLIEAAEDASRGNFTDSQRNLIVNFAYKMDDKDEVLGLVNRMMTAIRRPGSEYTRSLMNETQAQIDNFPDGVIGFTEMHEAGIRLEHMYPLEKNRAVELYREGAEVFLLHGNPDNPEQAGQILAETENAILGHDGIFGITEAEWEVHKEREATAARQEKLEQDSAEKIDETLLLHGESRRFAIYQMDSGDEHTYQFMGIESAKSLGYTIDGKDYRMVYAAPWMPTITLDNIFERFNIDRPEDFRGHSLSVSDVIVINRGAEITAYYVDSFGFQELPEFVQQRMNMLEHNSVRAYPPVYKGTLEQAMGERDVDAYLDSRKLNLDCKKAIEEAIRENFDGLHLKQDAVKEVVERFGEERMNFVMANTIRELSHDGRFSRQNKDWAEHIEVPENISRGRNLNLDYVIESHPAVLDGFIDMARAEIRMQRIEQAIGENEVTITAETRGYEAEGHNGTWHTVDEREYAGEKFFFMEHDEYGSGVAGIIVSEHGQLVAEDLWNGYDTGALEAISEYLQEKGISVEGLMPELEPDELAYKIDDRYFAIQRTEEGYDYTFYALDYDEIDGGAYDNPDVSMRQAMEDILEDEDMSLENAVPIDYEDLMAEVEEAGERQMQLAQLLKNCPPSIFEDYDRERAVDTCEGIAMQFTKSKGYLTVQATEEGYFYIFYDSDLHEIHSNDYDDPKVSVQKATYEILKSERMDDMECIKVDYKEFEAMTIQHSKDLLQAGELRATSEIGRDEAALNGLSRAEVERGVLYHAQGILEEMGLENEVELLAARVHGSRSREELYRDDSDLNVVLSYRGNIREDSFFNELNAHGIAMAGIKVDINPIAEERITLAEYMKESEAYLDQQEIEKLAVDLDNFSYEYDTYEYKDTVENREEQVEKITEDILNKKTECLKDWLVEVSEESDIDSDVITARSLLSRLENAETLSIFTRQPEQEQPEATISFYVAECMEFPVMGEYHNNLTLEEAIKIYESIPADRLHGGKGIGFDLQDGDKDYSGEYELMCWDRVDRELIDMIPHYKESPLVQKAINDMEKYLNEKHGKVQEAEQTVEVKQEVSETPVKKESISVEPNREQNKEPAKGEKGELKKSVLQSLKEFQARAKAQEQKNKEAEKHKAHKKGNVEL